MTIFDKIINREIPADIVYEDEKCLAFKDINPVAPVHVLIIPKKPIQSMATVEPEDEVLIGYLMRKAADLAKELGKSDEGYRLVTNINEYGGQSVHHLHIHLLAGRPMEWPPG